MSKPWYYTIGYPVKVFISGVWKEGMICDAYRYEADSVSVLTTNGIVVIYGDSLKEGLIKPNLPDDNPWIPVGECLPKDTEYSRVYVTVQYPCGVTTISGKWDHGYFIHNNGKLVKDPVLAWKYIRYPEPYKESNEE